MQEHVADEDHRDHLVASEGLLRGCTHTDAESEDAVACTPQTELDEAREPGVLLMEIVVDLDLAVSLGAVPGLSVVVKSHVIVEEGVEDGTAV